MSILEHRGTADYLQPLAKAVCDAAARLLSSVKGREVTSDTIGDVRLVIDDTLHKLLLENADARKGVLHYIAESQAPATELDMVNAGEQAKSEKYISTEEAANILDCSRPYVAMLCDEGEIKGVTKTRGGHRRIPLSAILELKQEQDNLPDANYKKAHAEMGLYDIPEETFLKPTR